MGEWIPPRRVNTTISPDVCYDSRYGLAHTYSCRHLVGVGGGDPLQRKTTQHHTTQHSTTYCSAVEANCFNQVKKKASAILK